MVLKEEKKLMSKRLVTVFGATLLLLALAAVGLGQAQPTVTKVTAVQNPDGTYTIVEYPVGKETIVTLNPVGLTGATGTATILRNPDGTTIKLNLTSLPADITAMNIYAVDPTGAVTLLGPIQVANGVGTFTTTSQLTKFMLVASPEPTLTTYDANTKIYFRSAAPAGLALVPVAAIGEKVAAVAQPVTSEYQVPMLGIPNFKKGDDTKLKVNFSGAMEGARANIFIEPHKRGNMSEVKMRFHDLKEAPKGFTYVLWAASADGKFARLGQIVNVKDRNEAEIKTEVPFEDFGLLLTVEDAGGFNALVTPAGRRVGVIEIIK
jgi:hypothetical protein